MRDLRHRRLLALCAAATTLAVGAAALAHLPRFVVVHTELGPHRVRTYGATVADALRDARITLAREDRVRPSPDTPLAAGMTIAVRRAFPVTLVADGHTRVHLTAAPTVEAFLAEAKVPLRARDRIFPSPPTGLWPGATVRVLRIETRIIAIDEAVPFASLSRLDATLPRGKARVVQEGRPGVRTRRIAVITADGREIERRALSVALTRPPVDRVLAVGTRIVYASRGEFAGKEVLEMQATAYAPWHGKGVDGTTAIGLKAGYGVVAVDPAVIPLGSILFIDGYGRAIAGDTGGAIKGYRIDLGFDTVREAYRFGRRPVRVYILSTPAPRRH